MRSCGFIDYFANHSLQGFTKITQTTEKRHFGSDQFLLRQAAEHALVQSI